MGVTGTYGRFDEISLDELKKARTEDLVNRFFGREIDILNDICTVNERRVYRTDMASKNQENVTGDYTVDLPMAFGRLLVAITRTFFLCLSLSSCVRSALTT